MCFSAFVALVTLMSAVYALPRPTIRTTTATTAITTNTHHDKPALITRDDDDKYPPAPIRQPTFSTAFTKRETPTESTADAFVAAKRTQSTADALYARTQTTADAFLATKPTPTDSISQKDVALSLLKLYNVSHEDCKTLVTLNETSLSRRQFVPPIPLINATETCLEAYPQLQKRAVVIPPVRWTDEIASALNITKPASNTTPGNDSAAGTISTGSKGFNMTFEQCEAAKKDLKSAGLFIYPFLSEIVAECLDAYPPIVFPPVPPMPPVVIPPAGREDEGEPAGDETTKPAGDIEAAFDRTVDLDMIYAGIPRGLHLPFEQCEAAGKIVKVFHNDEILRKVVTNCREAYPPPGLGSPDMAVARRGEEKSASNTATANDTMTDTDAAGSNDLIVTVEHFDKAIKLQKEHVAEHDEDDATGRELKQEVADCLEAYLPWTVFPPGGMPPGFLPGGILTRRDDAVAEDKTTKPARETTTGNDTTAGTGLTTSELIKLNAQHCDAAKQFLKEHNSQLDIDDEVGRALSLTVLECLVSTPPESFYPPQDDSLQIDGPKSIPQIHARPFWSPTSTLEETPNPDRTTLRTSYQLAPHEERAELAKRCYTWEKAREPCYWPLPEASFAEFPGSEDIKVSHKRPVHTGGRHGHGSRDVSPPSVEEAEESFDDPKSIEEVEKLMKDIEAAKPIEEPKVSFDDAESIKEVEEAEESFEDPKSIEQVEELMNEFEEADLEEDDNRGQYEGCDSNGTTGGKDEYPCPCNGFDCRKRDTDAVPTAIVALRTETPMEHHLPQPLPTTFDVRFRTKPDGVQPMWTETTLEQHPPQPTWTGAGSGPEKRGGGIDGFPLYPTYTL